MVLTEAPVLRKHTAYRSRGGHPATNDVLDAIAKAAARAGVDPSVARPHRPAPSRPASAAAAGGVPQLMLHNDRCMRHFVHVHGTIMRRMHLSLIHI